MGQHILRDRVARQHEMAQRLRLDGDQVGPEPAPDSWILDENGGDVARDDLARRGADSAAAHDDPAQQIAGERPPGTTHLPAVAH